MKINSELEKIISGLRKNYPEYSREDELICRVSGWIHVASKSLIPNSDLRVAEDQIDAYEERKTHDKNLVEKLWEIVDHAWEIYGEISSNQSRLSLMKSIFHFGNLRCPLRA